FHLRSSIVPILLAVTACATQAPLPTNRIIEQQVDLKTDPKKARLIDAATKVVGKANDVGVREIRTQTVNGRLVVDFILMNERGRRDVINYRLRWLDPNGMATGQYDPWETIALEGHEQSVLSVTAPTVAATDFRLELKPNQ
ncbi:MAG TPA: YcfL family protein, partial [Geomonas sp.]|nr:YcfL family protein [Geomonas sp.]